MLLQGRAISFLSDTFVEYRYFLMEDVDHIFTQLCICQYELTDLDFVLWDITQYYDFYLALDTGCSLMAPLVLANIWNFLDFLTFGS